MRCRGRRAVRVRGKLLAARCLVPLKERLGQTQPVPARARPDANALADERTALAVTRTLVALERTLMAWVRTATSLISFGFTIYKFFEYLQGQSAQPPSDRILTPRVVALVMIGLGIGALILATLQFRNQATTLRTAYSQYGPFRESIATGVATIMSALGLLGFVLVFLRQ